MKRRAWRDVVIPNRQEILERIEAGDSMQVIANDLGIKRHWLLDYWELPVNAIEYARSRVRAATVLVEETKDIADTSLPQVGELMKAKLKIQTRQWIARHWDRSRYGDIPQQQTGPPMAFIHAEVIRKRSAELTAAPLELAAESAETNRESAENEQTAVSPHQLAESVAQ